MVAEVQASTQSGELEFNIQPRPIEDADTVLRIDAVVTVPSNIPLYLSTDTGEIEVKKLSNPAIAANSKSGDLRLTASSIMHANTGRGRIRATIMRPGWSGESEFSTESGQIQAFFPLSKNLSIDAQAVEIKSEFKLGIQHLDGVSRAQFTAGDGTDKIKVKSQQGKVELYSLVFDPRVYGTPSITENN